MSYTVIVEQNGQRVSRTGMPVTMNEVLDYLRGWMSPFHASGEIVVLIAQDQEQPRRFSLRVAGRSVSLQSLN